MLRRKGRTRMVGFRYSHITAAVLMAASFNANALGLTGALGGGLLDSVRTIQSTLGKTIPTQKILGQEVSLGIVGPNVQGLVTTLQKDLLGLKPSGQRAPEAVDKYTGQVIKDGAVIITWQGDEIMDDSVADSDFISVIDAEPNSTTYGHIIWNANLPAYLAANNPGAALGHTSDIHNEPHHGNTYSQFIDPRTGKKLLFVGGLISGNMFRYDITDPRAVETAELAICGNELLISSLTDDIFPLPNGHMVATYMSGRTYAGPGALVEFSPYRKALCAGGLPYIPGFNEDQFLAEHSAVVLGGPKRYRPNPVTGNTDSGLEAYPHGMWLTADGKYLVTSDYAMAASIGVGDPIQNLFASTGWLNAPLSANDTSIRMYGTTVRVWDANDLSKGPINISQVPDGPRVEDFYLHDEPEGLMPFSLPHKKGHVDANGNFVPHKGAFVSAMCGGVMYYTSDITAKEVKWNAVYDVGPCAGVSVFAISEDDKFLAFPVAGIAEPGAPIYDRDYPGEHDRRVMVMDIRPLLAKGTGEIECGFPPADPTRPANTSLGLPKPGDALNNRVHNNGAADCPVIVSQIVHNSPMNYSTRGGAHYVQFDRFGAATNGLPFGGPLEPLRRIVWTDYFVNLNHMGLQGTGSDGDRKVYVAHFDPNTGHIALDTNFRDELTGEVGVAFTSDARREWHWPNRGVTGSARPHVAMFERKGVILKEPWQE